MLCMWVFSGQLVFSVTLKSKGTSFLPWRMGVMMLLFIPCLIPCFTLLICRIINSTQFVMTSVEKKGDVSIMVLKKWTLQEPTDKIQLLLAKVEEETGIENIKKKMRDC